jgi:Ni/Co efflux regulator RcnB
MKKILLSTVAVATLATAATASTSSELATLKAQMAAMMKKIDSLEAKQAKAEKQANKKQVVEVASVSPKGTLVKSKVPVLKFSGKHYLGFVSSKAEGSDRENAFETRRNYLQVKGYFAEDAKDYFRITLDTFHNDGDDGEDEGSWEVRLKYAYLYLDNILPYTGVEIGQAHRPWIDNEEHGGWNYRSISKVFVEASNGAHLTNSADLGVNFKTKTEYFSSELGLFNGEGYHGVEEGDGLSAEWRLTGHILGGGTHKAKKKNTYANVSFFGQWNDTSNKHGDEDLNWYGVHAVYNQPEFLFAGQYVETVDAADTLGGTNYAGKGYSFNGEFRFAKDWNLIGRYDNFEKDNSYFGEQTTTIAGVTYKYNKSVEFIANYLGEGNLKDTGVDSDALMLTAEVNW